MTPQEKRIAIAEACGLKLVQADDGWWDLDDRGKIIRLGGYKSDVVKDLPDYLNDLNAMHEAEKVLTDELMVERYYCELSAIVCGWKRCWKVSEADHTKTFVATAAQRADAFLLTLNLMKP